MGDDDDILASLEFHDDRLKSDHDVSVAFSASVPIIVFVIIPGLEIFRVLIGNLLVGETITYTRIKLVQRLPLKLIVALGRYGEKAGGLDGALQSGCPDG